MPQARRRPAQTFVKSVLSVQQLCMGMRRTRACAECTLGTEQPRRESCCRPERRRKSTHIYIGGKETGRTARRRRPAVHTHTQLCDDSGIRVTWLACTVFGAVGRGGRTFEASNSTAGTENTPRRRHRRPASNPATQRVWAMRRVTSSTCGTIANIDLYYIL